MRGDRLTVRLQPHLGAMAADRGKHVRREDQVDVVERATGDQRQRAAPVRSCNCFSASLHELRRYPHFARRRREIEQFTVDIQQHGGLVLNGGIGGLRAGALSAASYLVVMLLQGISANLARFIRSSFNKCQRLRDGSSSRFALGRNGPSAT